MLIAQWNRKKRVSKETHDLRLRLFFRLGICFSRGDTVRPFSTHFCRVWHVARRFRAWRWYRPSLHLLPFFHKTRVPRVGAPVTSLTPSGLTPTTKARFLGSAYTTPLSAAPRRTASVARRCLTSILMKEYPEICIIQIITVHFVESGILRIYLGKHHVNISPMCIT